MSPAPSSLIRGSRTMISAVTRRTVLRLPVVAHQIAGPGRLVHRPARSKLHHERLDVEHRRPIDSVQTAHPELEAVDVDQFAPADADPVGAGLGSLGEDADFGPLGVATGAAGPTGHVAVIDEVEEVHDLEVGELVEAQRGVGAEQLAVQHDRGLDVAPAVVAEVGTAAVDVADGLNVQLHPLYASRTLTTPASPSTSRRAPSGMARV